MLLLLGCAPPSTDSAPAPVDYAAPGAWTVGRHTLQLADDGRDRPLTVETWFPTEAAPTDEAVSALVGDAEDRAAYEALLAVAPEGCPTRTWSVATDAPPAEGPWPLVLMSHCHECTRFSTATVAMHLATHGFVVAAPDHDGNTLFDALAGEALDLDTDTLALRVGDLEGVLAEGARGTLGVDVDAARIGAFGHSFGSVTAAKLLQDRAGSDDAPISAMLVGAPPENPLLPGVSMEAFAAPLLFEVLAEDHSVGAAGNLIITKNYEAARGPAWLATVRDGGHWSPSDLVGVTESFMPGCGDDTREATREPFTYLEPALGRAATATLAATFFAGTLADDAAALERLDSELDAAVSIEHR